MSEALPFPYRLGRIARSHGLRGDVLLQMFRRRDLALDPARLRSLRLKAPLSVELEHEDERLEQLSVTHVRWVDPMRVILRFSNVSDRDQADRLVGAYFDVEPGQLVPELNDAVDACFEARVLDVDTGARLGRVEAIRDNGAQALLEIALEAQPDGDAALVPVVPELVVDIGSDAEGRFVRIRRLPGLLEANQ